MRKEIIDYIYSKNDLKEFLRNQPTWYRKLTRNPEEIKKFEIASLHFFERQYLSVSRNFQAIFKWHQ